MKKNMGSMDKTIRIILAVVFAVLYITGIAKGTFGIILLLLGGVFILTSMLGTCPLYLPFGINTCKRVEKK